MNIKHMFNESNVASEPVFGPQWTVQSCGSQRSSSTFCSLPQGKAPPLTMGILESLLAILPEETWAAPLLSLIQNLAGGRSHHQSHPLAELAPPLPSPNSTPLHHHHPPQQALPLTSADGEPDGRTAHAETQCQLVWPKHGQCLLSGYHKCLYTQSQQYKHTTGNKAHRIGPLGHIIKATVQDFNWAVPKYWLGLEKM